MYRRDSSLADDERDTQRYLDVHWCNQTSLQREHRPVRSHFRLGRVFTSLVQCACVRLVLFILSLRSEWCQRVVEVLLAIEPVLVVEATHWIGIQAYVAVLRCCHACGTVRQGSLAIPEDRLFRVGWIGERNQFPVDRHDTVLEARRRGIVGIEALVQTVTVVFRAVNRLDVS